MKFGRKKTPSQPEKAPGVPLRRMLAGYFASTIAGSAAVLLIWWLLLMAIMAAGFVMPAYTLRESYLQAQPALEQCTRETFEQELDGFSRWALYSGPGGELLATNMDKWHLKQAQNAWQGGSGNLGYLQYHIAVPLADGSICFLQYDYAVMYADPVLQHALPDFQTLWLVILAAGCLAWVWANTRRTGRRITADLALLTQEGERFQSAARGDLAQAAPPARAHTREAGQVLRAMEKMRAELSDSLKNQWRMEQQRAEQVAALAHDLKTPLTVVSGNAELLAEEELTPEQRRLAEAILRGASRAEEYLGRLRELSAAELKAAQGTECFAPISPQAFWRELTAAANNLCAAKRIALAAGEPPSGELRGDRPALARALENLLENAVRYTPQGGTIRLEARREGGLLGLAVLDGGPGFSAAALANAGRLFYTEDAARAQTGHQGMGLHYAGTVAQRHGGRLQIENLPQGGARATLWIKAG